MRSALAAVFCLTWLGLAAGQDYPIGLPKPMGGPIVGPDGRVRTGLDAHPVPSPWSGGIDFGISGSQGNTDTLKLRAGLDLRYDDPDDFALLNVLYILNQANQGELENKGFALVRNEMPMDMGLDWYAQGSVEYDEFRTVYLRIAQWQTTGEVEWKASDHVSLLARAGITRTTKFAFSDDAKGNHPFFEDETRAAPYARVAARFTFGKTLLEKWQEN